MTRYICVSIWCFFLTFSAPAQQKSAVYTVVFYNTENLFDTVDNPLKHDDDFTPGGAFKYTGRLYKARLQKIARVISEAGKELDADGADIIGLAEVENDVVLKDLAAQEAIRQRKYKYLWFDGPDLRGINTAMLYNPVHFRLLQARPLMVKLQGDPTRFVLFVSGVMGGDTLHILVNHWPSRREGKAKTEPDRMEAAKVNRHVVDSLLAANPKARIVLMGDFNDNPDDASIKDGLRTVKDKGAVGTDNLFNPWLNIYKSGEGTLRYKKHWDLFDQILVTQSFMGGKGLRYNSVEIFKKDYLFTKNGNFSGYPHRSFGGTRWLNGYSDHLPAILYLSTTNK